MRTPFSAICYDMPSLWNISSSVLKATGFTRLDRGVVSNALADENRGLLTIHRRQLQTLAVYPRVMTCLSAPGSWLGCICPHLGHLHEHAQFDESEMWLRYLDEFFKHGNQNAHTLLTIKYRH